MNRIQIIKKQLLHYVTSIKYIWSQITHPLIIKGTKNMNLKGYRLYGNSIREPINLIDSTTVTTGVYIDSDGTEVTNAVAKISDYIEVNQGEYYALEYEIPEDKNQYLRINYFTSEKIWVSQVYYAISITATIKSRLILIPENISYVRISYHTIDNSKFFHRVNPDNPVEVESVGDLTTKNLLYADKSDARNGMTLSIKGSLFTIGGAVISTGAQPGIQYTESYAVLLKANTKYTLSTHYLEGELTLATEPIWIGLRKSDNSWVSGTTMGINTSNYKTTYLFSGANSFADNINYLLGLALSLPLLS